MDYIDAEAQRKTIVAALKESLALLESGEPVPALLVVVIRKIVEVDPTHAAVDAITGLFVSDARNNVIATNYLLNVCGELAKKLAENLGLIKLDVQKGIYHVH